MGPQVLLLPPGAGLVRCVASGACCPSCACWSDAIHSSYQRRVADLPVADRQVVVSFTTSSWRMTCD